MERAGIPRKPNIAYSTVVYVDETDQKALDTALFRASRAYEGLLPLESPARPSRTEVPSRWRATTITRARRARRGLDHVEHLQSGLHHGERAGFCRSPETVTRKLRKAAEIGFFNTFMGEFNFADLPRPI